MRVAIRTLVSLSIVSLVSLSILTAASVSYSDEPGDVLPGVSSSSAASQETADRKSLWSLAPICRPPLPNVRSTDWPRSQIDYFILERLESAGLSPVRDAGPRSLVRRAFFDLTGLPPTPEDVAAYLADESEYRFERLVDRLLSSPQFGECWGRHWLDVARFAESSGKEFNFTYPHAWPYRDYVIDAMSADKPFDRFLCEQLAGDLLHAEHLQDTGTGDEEELLIATGFLAIGPKRHNSGGKVFIADVVDELIDTTMRSMLGLTVACARCHDHKFDPISTNDYYALAGIFSSTKPLYGTIKQKYSNIPTRVVPIGPDARAKHDAAEEHDGKIRQTNDKLKQSKEELKKVEEAVKKKESEESSQADDGQTQQSTEQSTEKSTEQPEGDEANLSKIAELKGNIAQLEKELKELEKTRPTRPKYAVSAEDRDKPANAQIAIQGNSGQLGDEVPRGFLSCVSLKSVTAPNMEQSGRMELARWVTSAENPLTARVMVNRVWHHLFGKGVVRTVDNFGKLGRPPSHPELLDWLATEFMDNGWSVKHIIREIMLSHAYQLSSSRDATSVEVDPENILLWRVAPRRLEVEALRDAILSISGQLDLSRPEGSTVTGLGDRLVRGIGRDQLQPPSNHRSVYLPVVRDYLPEMFELFDFPSPDLVSGRRTTTTDPLQDLYLRNDPVVIDAAIHTAQRLIRAHADNLEKRVDLAFELSFSRPPDEAEREAALSLVLATRSEFEQDAEANKADPNRSDPEVRAWAAVCQSLFGSAEFRYQVDID